MSPRTLSWSSLYIYFPWGYAALQTTLLHLKSLNETDIIPFSLFYLFGISKGNPYTFFLQNASQDNDTHPESPTLYLAS